MNTTLRAFASLPVMLLLTVGWGKDAGQSARPRAVTPPPAPSEPFLDRVRNEDWPPPQQPRDIPPVETVQRRTGMEVRYQRVFVDIEDQVATVRVRQLFVNHTGRDAEASFQVALPRDASVSDFSYWVGEKRIASEVQDKDQARATYDRIAARQRDPGLLEQEGRHLFRARVFPVPAGGQTPVELVYTRLLPYDKGSIAFEYPLTGTDTAVTYGAWSLALSIRDQQEILDISTPGMAATPRRESKHQYSLSMERSSFTPDQDFTLRYKVRAEDFGVRFLTHRGEGEPGYFMLMLAPMDPEAGGKTEVVNKDVVFVFDKSSSMEGEKMEQARAALSYCVGRLNPGDRFSIVAFSDYVEAFSNELLPATRENLDKGQRFARNLMADGATDIHAGLMKGLTMMRGGKDRQRTIVFMTDGLPTAGVTNAKDIIDAIGKANEARTRIFAFGVGDDVDDYLLLKLADANRGVEEDVKTGESIEAKISGFFNKVSMPVLVDLAVKVEGVETTMVYPASLPDVFQGAQLVMAGRYLDQGKAAIHLTGQRKGKPWRFTKTVNFPGHDAKNTVVPRLWAQDRVDYLTDYLQLTSQNEELRQEVISLGKRYRISTPYTSFLAVPEWEKDSITLRPPPEPMPAPCPTCTDLRGAPVRGQSGESLMAKEAAEKDGESGPWVEHPPFQTEEAMEPGFGGNRNASHVEEAYQVMLSDTGEIRSAKAVFPWGGSKDLTRDPNIGRWYLRFDTPAGHHGTDFVVRVEVTLKTGVKRVVSQLFTAGREAPLARVWITLQQQGQETVLTIAGDADTRIISATAQAQGEHETALTVSGRLHGAVKTRGAKGALTLRLKDQQGRTYQMQAALP